MNGQNRKRPTYKKGVWDSAPKWSPDGKYIVFSRKEDDDYKVMMMKSDGSSLHQLNLPFALHPNFTKDYKVVYSSHWNETGDIFISDSSGLNKKQLTNTDGADGHPYVSPDGSKIVFFSTRNGDKDVYTMNLDGTNQKRITSMEGEEWDVSWSPNGNKITFISLIEKRYNNFIVNSDGTELRNISNSEWSESGISWINKE